MAFLSSIIFIRDIEHGLAQGSEFPALQFADDAIGGQIQVQGGNGNVPFRQRAEIRAAFGNASW